ncbi:hypothetical protein ACWIUD_04940 [Helicobacter sp. 23-1044]
MSKKDSTKSKINALISAMVVFLTALLAVIGYAFVNYETLGFFKGCCVVVALIILTILFCLCVFSIKKDLKRLEKMK